MFLSVETTNKDFLIREISNQGIAITKKEPFSAKLYLKTNTKEFDAVSFKNKDHLKEFKFNENSNYWEFKKKYGDLGLYGDVQPIFQFLSKYKIDLNKLKDVKPWSIDIEVYAKGEFPSPDKADKFPIVAITMGDMSNNKYYSFVYDINNKLTIESTNDWSIFSYDSEIDMLESFISFWKSNLQNIHCITGWNSEAYDVPYIINRILVLFEDDNYIKNLSPFRVIKENNGKTNTFKILGLPHFDYIKLFKKFNFTPRSSYALENIAQDEFGYGKLNHSEYGSFADFYDNNINKYIEYNMKDVKLIKDLDNKFNYIALGINIAMLCRINYENIFSPIKCWEGLIYNKLNSMNIILPKRFFHKKESYMGAFVQEPKKGMIKDIISYDLTSLYPSTIRAINCSPETLINEVDNNATIESFLNGYIPTEHHKQNRIVDAAGNIYTKNIVGIIPELMKETFIERKAAQKISRDLNKKIAKLKKELNELKKLKNV